MDNLIIRLTALVYSIEDNISLYDSEIARIEYHRAEVENEGFFVFLAKDRDREGYANYLKNYISLLKKSRELMETEHKYLTSFISRYSHKGHEQPPVDDNNKDIW